MAELELASKSQRLVSLDVFRGMTIAGMILVNNPGSWSSLYKPLGHAKWDGWTPTDFIFPFFLFIVGVAMTFSFDKRLAAGASKAVLMGQVFARAAVLFLLGLILAGFPNFRLITPMILGVAGLQILSGLSLSPSDNAKSGQRYIAWACILISLGWVLVDFRYFNGPTRRGGFGDLFPLAATDEGSPIRVPGVLQRIGLCYFFASAIMLFTRSAGRVAWTVGLLVVYYLIMKYVDAPAGYVIGNGAKGIHVDAPDGAPFPGALNDWIDVKLLGAHLYSARPDPEGLLSSLPAIATTLLGILTGSWIHSNRTRSAKAAGLVVAGAVFLVLGFLLDRVMPINKKIWTSSYVVFMAGWSSVLLGACYYVIDVLGYKRWAVPFLVFGTNSILAFFASGIMARLLGMIRWGEGDDSTNLKAFLYSGFKSTFTEPKSASLAWALCYVVFWMLLITPLYRKRIFLKV